MSCLKLFLIILLLGASQQTSIFNQILAFWEPHDIYVIFNSTNSREDALATMHSPHYVSVRGDYSSFLPARELTPLFPNNLALVLITDNTCQTVIPILKDQLRQEIIAKRSNVLVIVQDAVKELLEVYFKSIWKLGMLNVFILDNSSIFSFNPFTNQFLIQNPATEYHQVISKDRAGNWYGAFINVPQIELYPGAQTITWNNQRIQVGKYIFIRRPFEKFFNATLHIYTPKVIDIGFELFNGTSSRVPSGLGGEVADGTAHLTFVTRTYAKSNYFDFLQPLQFGKCSLLVPKSTRIPQYTIVARVGFGWVGMSSIINLGMVLLSLGVIKRVLHVRLDLVKLMLELGAVFFGQSFKLKMTFMSMRWLIVAWLFICISLSTLFNAQIVTSFLTPWYFKEYSDPFEALDASGHNVYTFKDFYYFLKGNKNQLFATEERYQKLAKNLVGVQREEYFDRVHHPNGKDRFVALGMGENLIVQTVHLTDQMYSYYITKPMFINIMSNIVPRGSIIYHRYNDFKYRITEAGLFEYWKSLELLYDRKLGNVNFTEAHQRPLTITDLYSAFLVLVLGHILAASVFLFEILVACLRIKF